jgi:hypothetical protein
MVLRTYEMAIKHPVVVEAIGAGATIDWIFEEGMYVFRDGEWGPYKVSFEFVDDLMGELGVELAWQFLRHGTATDEMQPERLISSYATVLQWKEAARA